MIPSCWLSNINQEGRYVSGTIFLLAFTKHNCLGSERSEKKTILSVFVSVDEKIEVDAKTLRPFKLEAILNS